MTVFNGSSDKYSCFIMQIIINNAIILSFLESYKWGLLNDDIIYYKDNKGQHILNLNAKQYVCNYIMKYHACLRQEVMWQVWKDLINKGFDQHLMVFCVDLIGLLSCKNFNGHIYDIRSMVDPDMGFLEIEMICTKVGVDHTSSTY